MAYVETQDGTQIFYKEWGPKDGQPIVFSHGWPLQGDAFEDPGAYHRAQPEDAYLARLLGSETFIAFARNGKPDNMHAPRWPAYDLNKRSTMIFDLPPRVENDPRGREREYLGKVPYLQPGT